MGKEMSDPELELLRCVIEKLSQGVPLTRELVAECYYGTAPKSSAEQKSVSEKWIDFFSKRLHAIPQAELVAANHSRKRMGEMLHKLMT